MKNNKFDQFYTNPKVTDYLVAKIHDMFNLERYEIFEPAAGTGNFIDSLSKIGIDVNTKCYAFDIEPKNNNLIQKADFLELDINEYIANKSKNIVITNPPFGKRGDLAIKFINKSLEFADIVCMILPNTFNRHLTQKRIKESAKLIYSEYLPENSFLVKDKEYSVKCSFQIWVNENVQTWLNDKRLKNNNNFQKIKGLELFIHNNTTKTLKYFDKEVYKWNFAVVRQGYYDYSKKITNPGELKQNRQYLFIKTDNSYLLKLIEELDFEALANKNTTVKGFSNSDLINEIYKLHINKILKF